MPRIGKRGYPLVSGYAAALVDDKVLPIPNAPMGVLLDQASHAQLFSILVMPERSALLLANSDYVPQGIPRSLPSLVNGTW
jgi:hypothetical protein